MPAKDDLAALGLDDDEIELIKARRKQRKEEIEREVWVRNADGHEARLPFGTARNWLRKVGFDLDDEDPGQAEPDAEETEPETEPEGTRRFGRRVG